jgi:hypothetical protein
MDAWISDLSPKKKLGVAISLYRTLNDIGVVAGSIYLTAIAQTPNMITKISNTPFRAGGIVLAAPTILRSTAKDPVRDRRK